MVLEKKTFKDWAVFHFLFGNYSEFRNHMNKFKQDHLRYIPAKN
jgi:hypothetical protein